jgi:CO/xanthine dehydrogenase FAD-binding subunit
MVRIEYVEAASSDEVLAALSQWGPDARLIAGGTDVLMDIRRGKYTPPVLIGITEIPELQGIRPTEGGLWIGAVTTHHAVTMSPLVLERYPVLASASGKVGSHQIRNVATIGGNICNAVPCADTAPALLALDAQAHVLGPEGKRVLPLDGFFAGPGRSVLARNELLLGFVLPDRLAGAGGSYHKHSWREALDIQMCGAAVVLTADPGDCRCLEARIALGTAGPVPRRADAAEAALKGAVVNEELASELGRIAAAEARPRTSARATEEYRREMIEVLVKRAILDALAHIKGARS